MSLKELLKGREKLSKYDNLTRKIAILQKMIEQGKPLIIGNEEDIHGYYCQEVVYLPCETAKSLINNLEAEIAKLDED